MVQAQGFTMALTQHHSQEWIEKLFQSYVGATDLKLYFEQAERLHSDDTSINLSIHPIRFADDIFFSFETKNPALKEKLKKYEVNYNIFYHYADLVKAGYLKAHKKNAIEKNSLLIIGQTAKDKVLFDGERYLSLQDYEKELRELASKYEHIYFKPHPYAKNNKESIRFLKSLHPNFHTTYQNVYYLLANDHIEHLVGLNSSVLYEAKYFKKESTFLAKPYFDFASDQIGIYSDYFSSAFWADLLETPDKNITLPFKENRLRIALNDFWGYNEINANLILKEIIKSKIKYFLYRYVG